MSDEDDYEAHMGSIENATTFLTLLRVQIARMRQIEAIYERRVAEIFKEQGWPIGYRKPHAVEGVGDVEVIYSLSTQWDTEPLLKLWLHAYLEHREGDTDPYPLVAAFARAVGLTKVDGSYSSSLQWRSTPLKELGIDPGEYSTKTYGPPRVRITEATDD